jgi:putrescine aminotransferase
MTPQGAPEKLITLEEALRLSTVRNAEFHIRHLNPRLARLLDFIGGGTPIVRAAGSRYWDAEGREYLDFLTGFSAAGLGHNHPRVRNAIAAVDGMPALIEGLNHLAGALAHNLAILAPPGLDRVYFANSGAEVVDASIKVARSATGRARILACRGSFHGRTIGALSLIDNQTFRQSFEPLLPGVSHVDYGDPAALETALRPRETAGFIVEPIQGEGGMIVPAAAYLPAARELCTRNGTLMIADEVQTGLGRTGKMFAVNHEHVVPDVLLLGKTLGGGIIPLSALLTTDAFFRAAKGATPRTPFHTATFGGNTRACAAGLATLETLVEERLPERAGQSGKYLLDRLRGLQRRHPLIADVRGRGLMIGIEFAPATRGIATALSAQVLNKLSHDLFSGMVMMELHREYGIMTAYTLNNPNVLRLQPPLNVEREDLDYVVDSLDRTLSTLRSFPLAAVHSLSRYARLKRGTASR